jgi:glutamine amidotransferase-like uncharacterized protein
VRTLLSVPFFLAPLGFVLGACALDAGRAPVAVVEAQGMTEWDRVNLERNLRWVLARERADRVRPEPRLPGRPVGVFADAGVWHVGARSIVEALEKKKIACQVFDRSAFRSVELAQFDAIILPGGWAPLQWAAMGDPGLGVLKAYIEGGGRCLGICAGAYLLSRTTQYDGKAYPYPLGLFDGISRGPIQGLARFPNAGSTRVAVTAEGRRRGLTALSDEPLYYSGGPCFLAGTNVNTLARYPDGSAAAICRKVGKGEIVLIGVHPERPPPEKGGDDASPPAIAGELLRALLTAGK